MTTGSASSERFASLCGDLADETEALDSLVRPLDDDALWTLTPAEGWSITDQLSHLAGFDDHAVTALVDPDRFRVELEPVVALVIDPVADICARGRNMEPSAVRQWWFDARAALLDALDGDDPSRRIPWYGPDMSVMSHATARLMETWAHGQDVRDALGEPPLVSNRLRHVAHIGVGARAFSFLARGLEPPAEPIDVVIRGPQGDTWTWGPGDSADSVTAPAIDFAMLVTQRRHRDDLDLTVTGEAAQKWIEVAQAFAGGVGGGRRPGQFAD